MTSRWLIAAGATLAALAFAPAAEACRAVRSLTEAEVRERTLLFTANVTRLQRYPDGDGERIKAVLRTERSIYGESPAVVVAEDYLGPDDEVVIYCGGRRWIGDELRELSVGDVVVVAGWRGLSGEIAVRDMGRMGGTRARLLLNAPHP